MKIQVCRFIASCANRMAGYIELRVLGVITISTEWPLISSRMTQVIVTSAITILQRPSISSFTVATFGAISPVRGKSNFGQCAKLFLASPLAIFIPVGITCTSKHQRHLNHLRRSRHFLFSEKWTQVVVLKHVLKYERNIF